MADDRGTVHQIVWQDVFPATILLPTLRLAVGFRALVFATLGFVAMTAGWQAIGRAFPTGGNSDLGRLKEQFNQIAPWSGNLAVAESKAILVSSDGLGVSRPALDFNAGWQWNLTSPFVRAWHLLSTPFVQMMNSNWTFTQFAYLLAISLWSLAVWAFCGGAITRIAAVSLAREEQVSIGQAASFALSKWAAYFAAPLFPLLGAILLSLPLVVVGLLLRSSVGIVIAGFLWPLVLAAGVLMAVLMVALFFGWPLMWATISTEGTDSFDALSRSYAYTCQRPLQYLLYAVLAALLGVLGFVLVVLFAGAVVELSNWGVSWGSSSERLRDVLNHDDGFGSTLIHFWIGGVGAVVFGFMFSFLWTSSTAIYLLLRRQVDSTETDEVYVPEQEQLFGMPPLKSDAAGVPAPADEPNKADNGASA